MAKNFQYYMEKVTEVYFEESETIEKQIKHLKEYARNEDYEIIFDIFGATEEKNNTKEANTFIITELEKIKEKISDEKLKQKIENVLNHEDIKSSSINLTNIFNNIS